LLLSAAMRVRLSDPSLHADLVRYLRSHAYLAAAEHGAVTAVPINAVSERGDRARFERDLETWLARHADVIAELQASERDVGALTGEIQRLDDERRQAGYELKVAEREHRRAREAAAARQKSNQSADLALRTVAILSER
jgi:hypothetical protein